MTAKSNLHMVKFKTMPLLVLYSPWCYTQKMRYMNTRLLIRTKTSDRISQTFDVFSQHLAVNMVANFDPTFTKYHLSSNSYHFKECKVP